jgi:hypothetical protein
MDGGVAKDVPMVANPRFLLSRLHREGLHGHSFSCAYISPREPVSL